MEHERRLRDHEASSEAFAKIIATPVERTALRQASLFGLGSVGAGGGTNGKAGNGSPDGGGKMPNQFSGMG